MAKKILALALALALVLAAVLAANTLRKGSRQLQVAPLAPAAVDEDAVAQRLAQAVRLPTVSSLQDEHLNRAHFLALHALLQQQFPRVHASLRREVVGGLSLLYTWEGRDSTAPALLLAAHQDVVPIAPGTEGDWQQPPFAGVVRDGFVWGRGAWDDKGNLLAQLEAVEALLASGWRPPRTLYLAYGADEEVGGGRGAARIAALLQSRGVRLDMVLDEGLLVLDGLMPGVAQPTALIGVAEKGYLSLRLTATAAPGHASMPPADGGAAALLSAALVHLHHQQMRAQIGGVAAQMLDTLAPEMQGLARVALSNLWLFGPLVQKQLEAKPGTNANLRTTMALTLLQAGNKDNVLPGQAQATLNLRLLPGDTRAAALAHVQEQLARVAPAERLAVQELPGAREASKVASTQSRPYRLLNRTIREVFPDALVAPGLMIAATDSVHYEALSDHLFKFSPIRADSEDLKRFHGTNERLALQHYADAIRFYQRLLLQWGASGE